MAEYENVPVRPDTMEVVRDLRYEFRVDSMDAVVRELIDAHEDASNE